MFSHLSTAPGSPTPFLLHNQSCKVECMNYPASFFKYNKCSIRVLEEQFVFDGLFSANSLLTIFILQNGIEQYRFAVWDAPWDNHILSSSNSLYKYVNHSSSHIYGLQSPTLVPLSLFMSNYCTKLHAVRTLLKHNRLLKVQDRLDNFILSLFVSDSDEQFYNWLLTYSSSQICFYLFPLSLVSVIGEKYTSSVFGSFLFISPLLFLGMVKNAQDSCASGNVWGRELWQSSNGKCRPSLYSP